MSDIGKIAYFALALEIHLFLLWQTGPCFLILRYTYIYTIKFDDCIKACHDIHGKL